MAQEILVKSVSEHIIESNLTRVAVNLYGVVVGLTGAAFLVAAKKGLGIGSEAMGEQIRLVSSWSNGIGLSIFAAMCLYAGEMPQAVWKLSKQVIAGVAERYHQLPDSPFPEIPSEVIWPYVEHHEGETGFE